MEFLIVAGLMVLTLLFSLWFWSDNGFTKWFNRAADHLEGKDLEAKTAEVVPTPGPKYPEKPKKVRKRLTFTEDVGITTITYTFKDGSTMERPVMGSMVFVMGSRFDEDFQDRMLQYRTKGYFQHMKIDSQEAARGVIARERKSGFIYWPDGSHMCLFSDFDHADFKTQPHTVSFEEDHFVKVEEIADGPAS